MKVTIYITVAGAVFASCKAPSYHFVSPSLNNTAYQQPNTGHVGIQFGTIGFGAKGGWAISDHVNVNGYLGALPEAQDDYTSRESELSIGFQTTPNNNAATTFYAGVGIGHNEKDKTGLAGNYTRPFVQIQRAVFDRKIFGSAYVDGSFGLRVNYLLYNGVNAGNQFDHDVTYTEPYLGFAVGGRNVRFEVLQGIAMKTSGTWGKELRIFPYFGNVGLLVKLRNNHSR